MLPFTDKETEQVPALLEEWCQALRGTLPPNWVSSFTTRKGQNDILNIVELQSKIVGVSISKSVQMFQDGTLQIHIENTCCTELLMKKGLRRIESPKDLNELIHQVSAHFRCTGVQGFSHVPPKEINKSFGEMTGQFWYSASCGKAVLINQTNLSSQCSKCAELQVTLENYCSSEGNNVTGSFIFVDPEVGGSAADPHGEQLVLEGGKLDLGKTIYKTLGQFWDELGVNESAQEYKSLPSKERR